MDEEKLMLTDLIQDSLNYELEQINIRQEEIDRIEKLIHANNQYIRKVSLQEDVDYLNNILLIQKELKDLGIDLDIYQNGERQYCFSVNGVPNDICCDSLETLNLCINSLMVGLLKREGAGIDI